jgi:cephalosporin hydroxylase
VSSVVADRAPLPTPELRLRFAEDLVRTTNNFRRTTWLGHTIRQNTLDLWVIQETIAEIRPSLLIECGTNYGGSALFYAHLFDLMGSGEVLTIDVERMHDLSHPRITFLQGSSVAPEIVARVRGKVRNAHGPVLVILDSDHSESHVRAELEAYAPCVTMGSYVQVQDGVIDQLPMFASGRPGPLPAIHAFLRDHRGFTIDGARCARFPVTHHPVGWLRRDVDRIGAAIAPLATEPHRRIAIFGTGSGARRVHDEAWLRGLDVVCFLERDERHAPDVLLGTPVRPLSTLRELTNVEALVVGSLSFDQEMGRDLTRLAKAAGLAAQVVIP